MEEITVVFDFDKTIIDVDSDNWVLDELGMGFTEMFNQLLLTTPWNTAMDKMMSEIQSKGVSTKEIIAVLHRTPIHPRIIPVIKSIYSAGCCLRIVSDANRFFIETILDHMGLRSCFSSIESNPGYIDEQGRVRIQPYQQDFSNSPHGCTNPNCAPNMCKGYALEKIILEQKYMKFIYLGDGKGDYCPSLKLREGDIVMPRKEFPIWDLISANPDLINGEVHGWGDGDDLEIILPKLINNLSKKTQGLDKVVNTAPTPTINCLYTTHVDCKRESIPVDEAIPSPLRVPF